MTDSTYEEFLAEAFCNPYRNNEYFHKIFDFLKQEKITAKMKKASEEQLPALQACCLELENFCKDFPSEKFKFDRKTKQSLGKMIKVILRKHGYFPVRNKNGRAKTKRIPNYLNSQFKNGAYYTLIGEVTVK